MISSFCTASCNSFVVLMFHPTTAQMPSHTHTYEDKYVELVAQNPGIDIDFNATTYNQYGTRTGTSDAAGSGQSHENRPPYYALCYVMKT